MMDRNCTRVSIGLPVHNGGNYIAQALDSILGQTYAHFELIVSDNGSIDETPAICKAYADRDRRIRYYRSDQNYGAAWNFNRTLELATGEFFKWAAHDDVCAPDFLRQCVRRLDKTPSAVLCYPRATVIDACGEFVEAYTVKLATDSPRPEKRFEEIVLTWHRCYEIFGLIRTQTLLETCRMGNYAMADRVLLGELALRGHFCEVADRLFFPRMHAQQSVKAQPTNYLREVWFDTRKTGRLVLPEWRISTGLVRAIRQAPLTVNEQMACYGCVGRWMWMRKKALAQDVMRALR